MADRRRPRSGGDYDEPSSRRDRVWYKEVQRTHRNGPVFSPSAPRDSNAARQEASAAVPPPASAGSASSSKPIFSGLLSAPATPYDACGRLDADLIAPYAAALKADGVSGVFACGTTGESMALSVAERKIVAEHWKRTKMQVCLHVGAQSPEDTKELAMHGQQIGVDAIAVMTPVFFRPTTVEAVVDLLCEVAAAAPRVPMLYYHYPDKTGMPFKLFDILTAAKKRGLDNLRGAKYTSLDLGDFMASKEIPGVTDMIYSWETNMCGAAMLGATAFIGAQFSIVAPLYARCIDAARKGDVKNAQLFQSWVAKFVNRFFAACGGFEKMVAACKFVVGLRLEADIGPMRTPGPRLSVKEQREVKQMMEKFVEEYGQVVKGMAPVSIAAVGGGATSAAQPEKKSPPNLRTMPYCSGSQDSLIKRRIDHVGQAISQDLRPLFPHMFGRGDKKECPRGDVNVAKFIDHTMLKPEATSADISKLCTEAKAQGFYAVCVNGSRAQQCLTELRGSDVEVAAVIGFPLGAMTKKAKAKEARQLVHMGCAEIDMVMNIGKFKDKDYSYVYEDVKGVVDACEGAVLKVIFETCLLSPEEIVDACVICVAAGAHFVKTSTGFNKAGATPEGLDIMIATVGNEAQVKAAGGVRDYATALAYVKAGIDRIGTSSGVTIMSGKSSSGGY